MGKSSFASQLSQHFKLHHLKIADVIKEAIEKLVGYLRKYTKITFLHMPTTDNNNNGP